MQLITRGQGFVNVDKARFIFDKRTFSMDGMHIKRVDEDINLKRFIYVVTNKKKEVYLPVQRVACFNLKTRQLIDITENDRSDFKIVAQLTALEQLRVLEFGDWYVNKQAIRNISLFVEDNRGKKSYEYVVYLDGGKSITASLDKEIKFKEKGK